MSRLTRSSDVLVFIHTVHRVFHTGTGLLVWLQIGLRGECDILPVFRLIHGRLFCWAKCIANVLVYDK